MAHSTEELELFKYDEVADASQVFSFEQALNDNWDKIDSFAGAIKSLSNLDAQGEKRFSDIWTELDKKLEAEVLLSENGYIKFNNGFLINYFDGTCGSWITYPMSYTSTNKPIACILNGTPGRGESVLVQTFSNTNVFFFGSYHGSGSIPYSVKCIVIGY